MKEKHLSYYKLIDAFQTDECPVCFITKQRIENYFDNLLYENINDVEFRKQFNENYGFCNYHSYKFLSYNDGLAISLTHKTLLIEKIKEFQLKTDKKILRYLKPKNKKCMVCKLSIEIEDRYLSIIQEYIDDPEFKESFLCSKGLCIPHYELLLARIKKIPEWISDFHIKNYSELLKKLEKYLDNCNFSPKKEHLILLDDEKVIWKKIINVLFGYEGRMT